MPKSKAIQAVARGPEGVSGERKRVSFFWLAYFLLCVGIIGGVSTYVLYLPCCLLSPVGSRVRRFGERCVRFGAALILKLQPWLSLTVQPTDLDESLLRGRMLVSNHRSTLDIFMLLALVPGLRILAKGSLLRVPLLGFMMKRTGQITVARGRLDSFWQALETVRLRLRLGETVVIFPEMTRGTPDMQGTLEFNAAPFSVALQEQIPVIPIALSGTGVAWPKGLRGVSRGTSVRLCILPELDPSQFTSANELRDEARRQIDAQLERAS